MTIPARIFYRWCADTVRPYTLSQGAEVAEQWTKDMLDWLGRETGETITYTFHAFQSTMTKQESARHDDGTYSVNIDTNRVFGDIQRESIRLGWGSMSGPSGAYTEIPGLRVFLRGLLDEEAGGYCGGKSGWVAYDQNNKEWHYHTILHKWTEPYNPMALFEGDPATLRMNQHYGEWITGAWGIWMKVTGQPSPDCLLYHTDHCKITGHFEWGHEASNALGMSLYDPYGGTNSDISEAQAERFRVFCEDYFAVPYEPPPPPPVGDTTPPSQPIAASLTFNKRPTPRVTFTWLPAADDIGVMKYRVWVNGEALPGYVQGLQVIDNKPKPRTTYTYQVSALDMAGNESAKSVPRAIQTPMWR